MSLLQVCERARAAVCEAATCGGHRLVLESGGSCFIEGMRDWLNSSGRSWPLPPREFLPSLLSFAQIPSTATSYPEQIGAGKYAV